MSRGNLDAAIKIKCELCESTLHKIHKFTFNHQYKGSNELWYKCKFCGLTKVLTTEQYLEYKLLELSENDVDSNKLAGFIIYYIYRKIFK